MRRRTAIFGTWLILAVLGVGGAAGAASTVTATARNVSPEQYVHEVCVSFLDWLTTTDTLDSAVIDLVGRVEQGALTPAKAKRKLLESIEDSITASESLVEGIRSAGAPKVGGGKTIAKHELRIGTTVAEIYTETRTGFAKMKIGDPADFLDRADTVIRAAAEGFRAAGDPIIPLWSHPRLLAAVEAESQCPASSSRFAPGDCLRAPDGFGAADVGLSEFEPVECTEPHHAEVVGVTDYPADVGTRFPGEKAVSSFAERFCLDAFESYVGVEFQESALDATKNRPSAETWVSGDRAIICLVQGPDGAVLAGSKRGSGE
jgi:hypothetical protein